MQHDVFQPQTIPPELVERAFALLRDIARRDGAAFIGEVRHDAEDILAELEPVNKDLEAATQAIWELGAADDLSRTEAKFYAEAAIAAIKRVRAEYGEGE